MKGFVLAHAVALTGIGAMIVVTALAEPIKARSDQCFANGDVVSFEGIASPGTNRSLWMLNLSRPICVTRAHPLSAGAHISGIRIIGTPPPLGIPLELTGKLMLGRSPSASTMFVALVVTSGRKVRVTSPVSRPARSISRAADSGAPQERTADERCGGPPYGGIMAGYQAFVRRFGRIIQLQKTLTGICNAKFGSAARDGLHKLGLTDAKIDCENTERLAGETITALKTLVSTIE